MALERMTNWDALMTSIWVIGEDLPKVKVLIDDSACCVTGNSLILNAAKNPLLVGGNCLFPVLADGIMVCPTKKMEVHGAKFDNNFTTSLHDENVVKAALLCFTLDNRLTHHLP
jgi:hypothetical protein